MPIAGSKGFLLIATTLLLTSGQLFQENRALAESPESPRAKAWLDNAVSEKRCPLTPVNVGEELGENSAHALLKRITISDHTLMIQGTDDPDHIVVSSGGSSSFVDIAWNGKHLGRFGPIKGMVLKGNGGDDVLIVKSSVSLPAVLDGGSGDDCLQGGSGADQLFGEDGNDVLIAGTGRPALNAGQGADRIVVPHHLGTLRYAPSANSGVLRLLAGIYDLQPLGSVSDPAPGGVPSPIILGTSDLGAEQNTPLLLEAIAASQAVVLTNATDTDSERLGSMLGHPSITKGLKSDKTALAAGDTASVVFFRKAPRAGTKAYDYNTGYFTGLSNPLGDRIVELLSRVFSATAIVPQAPGDSASNDLQQLADSYTASAVHQNTLGSGVQLANSVWDVRSFQNRSDFYYVRQEADYWTGSNQIGFFWLNSAENLIDSIQPTLIQTTPATTQCSQSTTSGVTWNISGTAGWNTLQGLNAALTGGVSVSHSQTITCPHISITNKSLPTAGITEWTYSTLTPSGAELISFTNQWIWEVPFRSYKSGQNHIDIGMSGLATFQGVPDCGEQCVSQVKPTQVVPLPFGDTFALQKPEVSSVNPTCVNAGNTFAINGTGLYPALVSSVLIGGTPLSSAQYSTGSDSQINVVAPEQSGEYLPIAVQTVEGVSNSNVTIEISTFGLCGAQGQKK